MHVSVRVIPGSIWEPTGKEYGSASSHCQPCIFQNPNDSSTTPPCSRARSVGSLHLSLRAQDGVVRVQKDLPLYELGAHTIVQRVKAGPFVPARALRGRGMSWGFVGVTGLVARK